MKSRRLLHRLNFVWVTIAILVVAVPLAGGAPEPDPRRPSDRALAAYFRAEVSNLASRCLAEVKTIEAWRSERELFRNQWFDMLGLSPLPARTDLKATITGRIERDEFTVEKLHFQSLPGLYVTANLYLPHRLTQPAPAILYLCGHAPVITNGVSYGNKTAYQHHGIWFARNGYVCLALDTVQLGEIQGIHHGTYRENLWWWNSRGYTPAGVEAWNSMRALDYLQSRPEVDGSRLGVTGRSGGGAYAWSVLALDDRVKAAAPVAGVTDLENHVVDGAVEGHCDCMFFVNTYGWDYPLMAALAAPRPLLICNSDKDSIFPLDGVSRLHAKVKHVYSLHRAASHLGLLITEGPHKDTQDLQLPVFRWFNRHLKGEDPVIEMAATKFFTPQQLKVFETLPTDERASRIHETFVPAAPPPLPPGSAAAWATQRDRWKRQLGERVFRGWPTGNEAISSKYRPPVVTDEVSLQVIEFDSQPNVPLRLHLLESTRVANPERVVLSVLGEEEWRAWFSILPALFQAELGVDPGPFHPTDEVTKLRFKKLARELDRDRVVMAFFTPRGIGSGAWSGDIRKQTQIRRRFMLLGQTLDSMRVWDIVAAVKVCHSEALRALPLTLQAEGDMGVNVLYSALFASGVDRLELTRLPASHRQGPDYLNVLRVLDVPQTLALAAERCPVNLIAPRPADWAYARAVQQNVGWPGERLRIAAE